VHLDWFGRRSARGSSATNDTVVIGAHLDSVDEGPGLNDNGSGSAAVLEMALQFAKSKAQTVNHVLFAWFGAEEIGLVGSRHFVRDLVDPATPTLHNVVANLNFDMLGSPNYVRILYKGDSCPESTRVGYVVMEELFSEYFQSAGLTVDLQDFSSTGGSDYFPFINNGIPAGSIATGAGSIKQDHERAIFGGISNTPLDSCYHAACDSYLNINVQALREMTAAAAFVTMRIANTRNPADPASYRR
jgi:Zn-dependent M28 family amino/carboxypeptidase